MSNFQTLGYVTGGIQGTNPSIFTASTTDSLGTITAVGYLNDLTTKVKLNDYFFINYSDTSTQPVGGGNGNEASTLGAFVVTVSGANVSLVSAPAVSGTAGAKAASNNAYANLASVNTPTISGQLAMFNDTAGSITDSGFLIASGLLNEPASDALTAHAGGGQGSALALTAEVNRVTTVATAGDSVKLPASAAGLSILVINSATNPMQVFGAGTDTINDIATATGVSQTGDSAVLYISSVAGKWYSIGLGNSFLAGSLPSSSAATGLIAHAGGGQGSALALTKSINNVTTVATAADSVALPASSAGLTVTVINSAAKPMQVFGAGTDTINGVATATGVSQLPGGVVRYVCAVAGNWLAENLNVGANGNYLMFSAIGALTAHAGGGQGSALALTRAINSIGTVGTAGDSVLLPVSLPGMFMVVNNAAAANAMDVFPSSGETINALTADTALSVAANKTIIFYCAVAGSWHSILTA